MKKHLNTLFVTLEGCWLSKDGDTVKVNAEGTCLLRVPLHNLEGIVTLGWDIGVSPYLMGACTERGITLSFCNPYGKFLAGVQGFMKGNILLRRDQYRWADDEEDGLVLPGNDRSQNCELPQFAFKGAENVRERFVGGGRLSGGFLPHGPWMQFRRHVAGH